MSSNNKNDKNNNNNHPALEAVKTALQACVQSERQPFSQRPNNAAPRIDESRLLAMRAQLLKDEMDGASDILQAKVKRQQLLAGVEQQLNAIWVGGAGGGRR
jgi:hypothetical protein